MDTILLSVTILSLTVALALAVMLAKLLREERARSEARVAALTAMAAQAAEIVVSPAAPMAPRPEPAPPPSRPTADLVLAPERLDAEDLELHTLDAPVAGVSHLFAEPAAPSPWGRRFAVIGALTAVVVAATVVLASMRPSATTSASVAVQQQAAVVDAAPLELVSLQHSQDARRLVISGLVQNPRTGGAISNVVATAFVFGPDGAFLTSSRAPLDFTRLAPGDESAFVINVAVTGPVARYRIGFRTADGRIIEHVDKRAPDALAQK